MDSTQIFSPLIAQIPATNVPDLGNFVFSMIYRPTYRFVLIACLFVRNRNEASCTSQLAVQSVHKMNSENGHEKYVLPLFMILFFNFL